MAFEIGDVCIPNISFKERQKRLKFAKIMLVISLAVLAGMLALGAESLWRLALYPLFASAGSSYFQWRDKT
jgi:hypothetical protein